VSDGGATVIVEGASLLARFRLGRIALAVLAIALALHVLAGSASVGFGGFVFAVASAWALVAIGLSIRRRRRRERASRMQMLAFLGFLVVASAGALFVVLRRRKTKDLAPPPDPRDVDRLVATSTSGAPR
jgi:hypothetical protein